MTQKVVPRALQPAAKLKWWKRTPDRLFGYQANKTAHVRWVMSIPMIPEEKPGDPKRVRARGVVNIDVVDDADVATRLSQDTVKIASIVDDLLKQGRLLCELW
jgi:hypothetical protein